jgi:hypothetical protein
MSSSLFVWFFLVFGPAVVFWLFFFLFLCVFAVFRCFFNRFVFVVLFVFARAFVVPALVFAVGALLVRRVGRSPVLPRFIFLDFPAVWLVVASFSCPVRTSVRPGLPRSSAAIRALRGGGGVGGFLAGLRRFDLISVRLRFSLGIAPFGSPTSPPRLSWPAITCWR